MKKSIAITLENFEIFSSIILSKHNKRVKGYPHIPDQAKIGLLKL